MLFRTILLMIDVYVISTRAFHHSAYFCFRRKKTVLVIIMINSIENIHAITYSLQDSPEIVNERNVVCSNTDMDQCGEFCRCTHVIKLASKKVTQIVLLNESKNVLLFEYIHTTCEYPLCQQIHKFSLLLYSCKLSCKYFNADLRIFH